MDSSCDGPTSARKCGVPVALSCVAAGALALYAAYRAGRRAAVEDAVGAPPADKKDAEHAKALALLSSLTRGERAAATQRPHTPRAKAADDGNYSVGLPRRRELSAEEKAAYERDGFVLCKGWFEAAEVQLLTTMIEQDHHIKDECISVGDTNGRDTKLTLWWRLGDDTYSQFSRSASLVNAASELMGRSEPYHSHTKVLLKEPKSGGAWEWHQDFGYWYDQGLLQPDKIVNAIIAVDRNTQENGCMRLLKRSHKLGRIQHGKFAGQVCANPLQVCAAMELPGHEIISLTMDPGDVAFMHSNTLHSSAPNNSDAWRRNIITAYNSRFNAPLPGSVAGQPEYNAIHVVGDEAVLKKGICPLDPAANHFLGQSANEDLVDAV